MASGRRVRLRGRRRDARGTCCRPRSAARERLEHRDCRLRRRRFHARQCQLERDTQEGATGDDGSLAKSREWRVDRQRVRQSERQGACHRGSKFRRGVRKRIVFERAEDESIDSGRRAEDRSLAQQDDVPAREVHVFVGRVIAGRPSLDGPVVGCVDVAHVHGQRHERASAARAASASSSCTAASSRSSHAKPMLT